MRQQKNKGFTIPEILLSVIVITVVSGMTFGDMLGMFDLNSARLEENNMKEVKKAFEAYMEDQGRLPPEGNILLGEPFWYDELVGYSNLSADQIHFDAWDRERHYRVFNQTQDFRDVSFDIYFGFVVSYGIDGELDSTLDANMVPADLTNPPLAFAATADEMIAYNTVELNPDGDDHLFKISDGKTKIANYRTTSDRLAAVVSALQIYAESMQNFTVSSGLDPTWAQKIFFPPSEYPVGYVAEAAQYSGAIGDVGTMLDDVSNFISDPSNVVQGLEPVDADRRKSMVELMQLLGLPDSYCCSAMELGTDGLPEPFYYSSNPLRKMPGNVPPCAPARGADATTDVIVPPRLVVGAPTPEDCM